MTYWYKKRKVKDMLFINGFMNCLGKARLQDMERYKINYGILYDALLYACRGREINYNSAGNQLLTRDEIFEKVINIDLAGVISYERVIDTFVRKFTLTVPGSLRNRFIKGLENDRDDGN